MESDANLITFSSRTQMAERLADLIAANVTAAIGERGAARLAISGGSTPTGLYRTLAGREIDWSSARAMLVDERWKRRDRTKRSREKRCVRIMAAASP